MYVGFDIGGTNVKYGVLNAQGEILEKGIIPTKLELEGLLTELTEIASAYQQKHEIEGIGVSAPGIVQKNGLMLTGGAIQALYGVNLKEELETRTGLPVAVENDANAAAIAEHWIGNAIGIDNYLCVVLGTGVGGGIIINGQVYRGAHGMAGEFGYMMTHDLDLSQNIEETSLNWTSAVVGGLYRQYNRAMKQVDPDFVSVHDANVIMTLAREHDEIAERVMNQFYQDIAVGMINLIGCFDPEVILIGGGISANQEFMEKLTATIDDLEAKHASINFLKGKTIAPVKPAKLRNDAGLIGAVYQVKQQMQKVNLTV